MLFILSLTQLLAVIVLHTTIGSVGNSRFSTQGKFLPIGNRLLGNNYEFSPDIATGLTRHIRSISFRYIYFFPLKTDYKL